MSEEKKIEQTSFSHSPVITARLKELNSPLVIEGADYRYVAIGDKIFPLKSDIVDSFYEASRRKKRATYMEYVKLNKRGK